MPRDFPQERDGACRCGLRFGVVTKAKLIRTSIQALVKSGCELRECVLQPQLRGSVASLAVVAEAGPQSLHAVRAQPASASSPRM